MNEEKSNAPIITVIVVVALLLLAVPCLLGLLFFGGWFLYQSALPPQRPAPVLVPEPSQPRPVDPLPNN